MEEPYLCKHVGRTINLQWLRHAQPYKQGESWRWARRNKEGWNFLFSVKDQPLFKDEVFGFWPRAQSTDDADWMWLKSRAGGKKAACVCCHSGFFVYSQSSFLSKDFIACSVHLRHFKSKCYQSWDLFRHHPLLQHEPFPKCVCDSQSRALGQFIQQPRSFMVYRSFQLYYMPESEDKTSRGCSRLASFSLILGSSTVTNIKKVKFQSSRRTHTFSEKV